MEAVYLSSLSIYAPQDRATQLHFQLVDQGFQGPQSSVPNGHISPRSRTASNQEKNMVKFPLHK